MLMPASLFSPQRVVVSPELPRRRGVQKDKGHEGKKLFTTKLFTTDNHVTDAFSLDNDSLTLNGRPTPNTE